MPQLHTPAKTVTIKPKMALRLVYLQYEVISGLDMRKKLQLCRLSVDSYRVHVKGKKLVLSCAPV